MDTGDYPHEEAEATEESAPQEELQENSEDMRKRFEALFRTATDAQGGIMTGEGFCSMLTELGIVVEEEAVRQLVGDAWSQLDINLATDVYCHLREQQNGGDIKADREEAQLTVMETVYISPWEWLWRQITCATTPANTEFIVQMPTVNIQPRHLLVLNTTVFMIVTNAAIIVAIALLWLDYANGVANDNYERMGETVGNFMEVYDQQLMLRHGGEMRDATAIVATVVDLETTSMMEKKRARMLSHGTLISTFLETDHNAADSEIHSVQYAMEALAKLSQAKYAQGSSLSQATWVRLVYAALTPFGSHGWHAVITDAQSGTLLGEVPAVCASSRCSWDVQCLAPQKTFDKVTTHEGTTSVQGLSASSVSVELSAGIRVCAMLLQSQSENIVRSAMISRSATPFSLLQRALQCEAVFATLSETSTAAQPAVEWRTPHSYVPATCYSANDNTACNAQNALIWSAMTTRESASQYLTDKSGTPAISVAIPSDVNLVLSVTVHRSVVIDEAIASLGDTFDYMNDIRIRVLGKTIELALIEENVSSRELSQESAFTMPEKCINGQCTRFAASYSLARGCFEMFGSMSDIAPDYRPEPVMQACTYSPMGISKVVTMMERDVAAIRSITCVSLIDQINANNPKFAATFEIQLVHYKGHALTRTFNPKEACPATSITCVSRPGYGIVYRSDCRDCSPEFALNATLLEYLTTPKLVKCDLKETSACTQKMALGSGVARLSLERSTSSGVVRMPDSRGVNIIGYHGFLENHSVGFVIKEDYSDVNGPVQEKINLSIGISCAIVFGFLVLLIALSYQVILTIEEEWMAFKRQILEKRSIFADEVREVMPGAVAEKIMNGRGIVAETATVCACFMHMGGTSVRTRKWQPMALCRFMTYTLHLVELISITYSIHRLRTIGDSAVFISTPQDAIQGAEQSAAEDDEEQWMNQFVIRMLCFCTNVSQLATIRYAHFPQRARLTRRVFGGNAFEYPDTSGNPDYLGYLRMPQFQIGIHTGLATVSVFHTATAPQYDILGATPSVACKIAATSKPELVLVSETTKDNATKHDKGGLFQYGEAKPMMLRGRGTINTYFLTVGDVRVPQQVIRDAAVRYSKLRVTFSSDAGIARILRDQSVMSASTASSSDNESKASDRATNSHEVESPM